jgi:hypothetical protein
MASVNEDPPSKVLSWLIVATVLAILGAVVVYALRPSPPGARQPISRAELAQLKETQRAQAIARAADAFSVDRPRLSARIENVRTAIASGDLTRAEKDVAGIRSDMQLLMEGRLKNAPAVTALQSALEAQATAISKAMAIETDYLQASAADDIQVVMSEWSKGGFGSIGMWTVSLKNTSTLATYHDIAYRTEYSAPSGTKVTQNTGLILDRLAPGEVKTFENLNDGFINTQASRAGFFVVSATKTRVR